MFDDSIEFVLKVYFGLAVFAAFVVGALFSAVIMWGF
jgi:hypothetical protein